MLTPIQFQQQHNLPLLGSGSGSGSADSWGGSTDPYGTDANGANANDPYSHWASAYGQWPQSTTTINEENFLSSFFFHLVNPYDNSTPTNSSSTAGADASGMDPAWLAYYQSMSYYSMMQAGMAGATSSGTETGTTSTTTDSTAASGTSSTTPGKSIFLPFFVCFIDSSN
jgi:hypothetical protein